MRAAGFNRLSIGSRNMEESMRFYEDLFGLECIPAYNSSFETQHKRCGGLDPHRHGG